MVENTLPSKPWNEASKNNHCSWEAIKWMYKYVMEFSEGVLQVIFYSFVF